MCKLVMCAEQWRSWVLINSYAKWRSKTLRVRRWRELS